jgi:hypothetical protein
MVFPVVVLVFDTDECSEEVLHGHAFSNSDVSTMFEST